MKRRSVLLVGLLILLLGACSDDSTDDAASSDGTSTTLEGSGVDETLPEFTEPPDELGTPGDQGVEYPDATTCSGVEAMFALLEPEVTEVLAGGDGTWTWAGLDASSLSADVYSDLAPDSTMVHIRGGEITFSEEVADLDRPALMADVSYASTTSETAGTIDVCVDIPVPGA